MSKTKTKEISKTTAPAFSDPDVQKIEIVQAGTAALIDREATQTQLEIDRAASERSADPAQSDPLGESGYVFIDDPQARLRYIAKRPKGNVTRDGTPVAACNITPLSANRPERGLTVYVSETENFQIASTVDDWMAVRSPQGKALIEPVESKAQSGS